MALHRRFFQAAEIDLNAAVTLAEDNGFQPALYHLQQAYEKLIKSYYIFLETTVNNTPENTAYDNCKRILGHDTQESTVSLLQELAQLETNRLQAELDSTTDADVLQAGQALLNAINGYRTSINNMVTRLDLRANYVNNVMNYAQTVENRYSYYQRSSNEVLSTQPDEQVLRIDLAMATLYPCLYRMQEISRYPLQEFFYNNLDLLNNTGQSCTQIIEILRDLFVLLRPQLG